MPAVFGFIIVLHILLVGIFIIRNSQLHSLQAKYKKFEPQKKILEDFQKEYTLLTRDTQTVSQLLQQRIIWSQKLDRLSAGLASGVWLDEVSISAKNFNLKGSAVSLEKTEVSLINKLLNNLKSDTLFFKDFTNLELGSIQTRSIGTTEVVDFNFTGRLK